MIKFLRARIQSYSQRYQVDLLYIIRNEFWVYLRLAISLAAGLAVMAVFTRVTSKELFGHYNFILATLAIVSLVSLPGLNVAVMRSTARGSDGDYARAVKTSFLWSLIGIPVLLGIGVYYYLQDSQPLGVTFMAAAIIFPFFYAPNTWDGFLQGKRRFSSMTIYGTLHAFISSAVIIGIIYLQPDNLIAIVIGYLLVHALISWWIFWKSLERIENRKIDPETRRYGFFLTTTNIVGTIAKNIDKLLVGALLGGPELAVYTVAIVVPTRLVDLLKAAWSPITPKLSAHDISLKDLALKAKGMIGFFLFLAAAGAVIYWMFIDDAIRLLFTSDYEAAGHFARPLLLLVLIAIPTQLLGTYVVATKKHRSIVMGFQIFPFLKLGIISGFIAAWGIDGAIWGLNVSMLVNLFMLLAGIPRSGGAKVTDG